MMNDKELKLLIALLRNIDKHGMDTFLSLSKKIKSSDIPCFDFVKEEHMDLIHRNAKLKVDYNDKSMRVLSGFESEYKNAVVSLIKLIKSKDKIKNLSAFTSFLNLNGIRIKKVASWDAGIYSLMLILKVKDTNFIRNLVFEDISEKNDDRSLESWSEVIMKKDQNNN